MGVDAEGFFTTPLPLSAADIEALNYAIQDCFDAEELNSGGGRPVFLHDRSLCAGEHLENVYKIDFDMDRYYGLHYERGPFLAHVTILEWVRSNVEGSRVYYGGDTSDEISEWTEKDRDETLRHFWRVGHKPYRRDK